MVITKPNRSPQKYSPSFMIALINQYKYCINLFVMQMTRMEGDLLADHETSATQQQPGRLGPLSFKVHPGFFCFFQQWTEMQNISYYECYNRVMRSHFDLEKIRTPLQKLFTNTQTDIHERSKEIYLRSSKNERIYIQSQGEPLVKYGYGREKEDEMEQVQKQLELYQQRREQAVAQKRKQFNQIRQQEELRNKRQNDEKARREQRLDALQRELGM